MGVKGILFISHIGKFVKVAAGIMNTHSHSADARMEVLCANAIRAGGILHAPDPFFSVTPQTKPCVSSMRIIFSEKL